MKIIPADGQISGAGNRDNGIAVTILLNRCVFLFRQIDDFFNIKLFIELVRKSTGNEKQKERKEKRGNSSEHP